ncbi:hypothetical protein BJD12_07015 [Xanthomonas vesicatoria ATCC 35937]|nr:hypothetical protein BJD12_07015 [Xanthomonas vesicatoria ATCC 35937]KTF33271.1 hypothetical protein LMG920_10220 [Xanthomonas vesicatoria]KTF37845.1 hypothetical protein LMG919_05730 [Xanthomonas vesicatoria]
MLDLRMDRRIACAGKVSDITIRIRPDFRMVGDRYGALRWKAAQCRRLATNMVDPKLVSIAAMCDANDIDCRLAAARKMAP